MEKKSKDAGKSSSLTDEKIQLLEEAGFVWAKRKGQVAWEEKFRELQEYLLKNGNCKSNFLKFRYLYSDIGRPANSIGIGFYSSHLVFPFCLSLVPTSRMLHF